MSLVFNDKTFQQADEGTVNVLKYTFGNGVNLVSVQQESLPDYICCQYISNCTNIVDGIPIHLNFMHLVQKINYLDKVTALT